MGQEAGIVIVRRVIAETFGIPEAAIDRTTTAEDVDGWDSLSHTILMVRLGRALGIEIPEAVAAEVANVGALADAVEALAP